MYKSFLVTAAVLGAVSVALGAFGAHGLKKIVTEQSLAIFETAVRYQFYHVFALLLTGILFKDYPSNQLIYAGYLFIAGMVVFCGSLYLLVAMPAYRWLGAITPLGGLSFILGWILLAAGILKRWSE